MAIFDENDPEMLKKFHEMMGPHAVDQQIRQAISMCWMALPAGRKSVEMVEAEIRRIVERALKDLKEDASVFGIKQSPPSA